MGWEVYHTNGQPQETHGNIAFTPGEPDAWRRYHDMVHDLLMEFGDAIQSKSTERITNNLQDAYTTTATVIYADLAYHAHAELQIDKTTMNIINNEGARKMLSRQYQPPYHHPFM